MLDPSDSKQRNTLVDLAGLLITLYILYSILGFRHFGCHPQDPMPAKWNDLNQQEPFEPLNGRPGAKTEPLFPEVKKAFP